MGKILDAIELIDQTKRTIASDAYLAALAKENAMLRERAQRAEVELDVLAETNAELATDFIRAQRWAHTWKQAAKNEREARYILQVLIAEHEAHGRIAPIPVAGVISAATTEDDWKAIWAGAGEAGK